MAPYRIRWKVAGDAFLPFSGTVEAHNILIEYYLQYEFKPYAHYFNVSDPESLKQY